MTLSNGGSVSLADYKQTLSLSSHTLSLSNGGGSIDLSPYLQTLTYSSNTLAISGHAAINLPTTVDNLGNHTASQNINTNGHWISNDGGNEGIFIASNGAVGIGTSSPGHIKLYVSGSASANLSSVGSYGRLRSANGCSTSNTNSRTASIYAINGVSASTIYAISDERTKNIQGLSDNQKDLETLLNIEVTDYTHIDTLEKGTAPHKKVIAQQVTKVFPQAVDTTSTEAIPNIMQMANIDEKGWIETLQCNVCTDLQKGDKIKIIFDKNEEIVEVLEIKENTFQIKPSTVHRLPSTVFIYGTLVNNFHIVDYDALKALNISATQELVKRNQQLIEQQTELEAKVEQLKQQAAKLDELEARILELKMER